MMCLTTSLPVTDALNQSLMVQLSAGSLFRASCLATLQPALWLTAAGRFVQEQEYLLA
jgi:hypothetical protein